MNITSKSRYALKIMIDLAEHQPGELTQRSGIAARQGIPLDYMDHILLRLRDHGLVESTRGRAGGYRLAREARDISVLEIFVAAEDAFEPVQCLDGGKGCTIEHFCHAKDAWSAISHAIRTSLSGIILSDIAARKSLVLPFVGQESHLQECRAPQRRHP